MYSAFSDNIITLNAVQNVSIYTTECVTSSVQYEMASMCLEKPIGAPSLSHPFKEIKHFLFPCLSPPGEHWCCVLSFVPAGSISSSSTCQIFWDASHLWWLLCLTVCLLGDFPSLQDVLGSTPTWIIWARVFSVANRWSCWGEEPVGGKAAGMQKGAEKKQGWVDTPVCCFVICASLSSGFALTGILPVQINIYWTPNLQSAGRNGCFLLNWFS